MGLKAGQEGNIEVRVRSLVNDSIAPLYSNAHTLAVTPYSLEQFLYVPGAYQDWTPSSAQIVRSPEKNNKYEGYIYFPTDKLAFKVCMRCAVSDSFAAAGTRARSTAMQNATTIERRVVIAVFPES